MNVERAMRRDLERAWRQEQAVGGNNQRLGLRGGQACQRGIVLQALRLSECQPVLAGQLLHRTPGQPQATAGGAVGLRQHQRDLVSRGKQRLQRAGREFWSAGEC
jgi:hypothetical protein